MHGLSSLLWKDAGIIKFAELLLRVLNCMEGQHGRFWQWLLEFIDKKAQSTRHVESALNGHSIIIRVRLIRIVPGLLLTEPRLGPELTERDLIPFYDAMTKGLDEVRIGILRNLAKFVTILGQTERRRCLESLGSFLSTDNKRNWRFRLELCQQVEQMVEIYEAEDVFKHLCPLSVDLITDSVAEIRRSALDLVTILASRLSECHLLGNCSEPNLVREFILELVETLCHSGRWVQRQTYATLSGHLVRRGAITPKQFAQDILPHLVSLSTDKVPNVRLVVAQTLTYVASLDYFLDPSNPHNEIVISTIEKLQDDPDRDVRFFSEMIESE